MRRKGSYENEYSSKPKVMSSINNSNLQQMQAFSNVDSSLGLNNANEEETTQTEGLDNLYLYEFENIEFKGDSRQN